jgi:hypothetical protein
VHALGMKLDIPDNVTVITIVAMLIAFATFIVSRVWK